MAGAPLRVEGYHRPATGRARGSSTVKIKEIRAAAIDLTPRPTTAPRVARQADRGFVSPMARYPEYRAVDWHARWKRAAWW